MQTFYASQTPPKNTAYQVEVHWLTNFPDYTLLKITPTISIRRWDTIEISVNKGSYEDVFEQIHSRESRSFRMIGIDDYKEIDDLNANTRVNVWRVRLEESKLVVS